MQNKKSISIVIPNYNGQHLLEKYIPYTLEAINKEAILYEIIVVDDNSQDDSVIFLQSAYPQIKLLINKINSGFSFSCNQGIQASKMELIMILNSDVKLSTYYFKNLWQYFDLENTFGVMGRINDMNTDRIQEAARMPKMNGFKLKTSWFYYLGNFQKTFTLYLSGANSIYDAQKLKLLGGFDSIFSPFYCEDLELSLRAWRLGFLCYYEHSAICEHELSTTTKSLKSRNYVKMVYFRNRFTFHALHLTGLPFVLWFLQITFLDLPVKVISGKFWILRSYWKFLKQLSTIFNHKRMFEIKIREHGQKYSLFDIINKIKNSVTGKTLYKV